MIEPKGPKPGSGRQPDTKEPRFEQGGIEQPMYATEPESPPPQRGPAGPSSDPFGGAWDLPRQPGAGPAASGHRQPSQPAGGQRQPGHAPAEPGQAVAGQAPPGQPRQAQAGQGAATAAAQAQSARDEHAELRAALAAAEANAKENHEQHLRALAEMENVRRRAQEDVSKAHKFAIEAFAEQMLPVRDSLEMALTVEVPSVESLREGVEATLRQLAHAFERNRVLVIDPLHQKFDPHLHQAVSMAPSKDVAPNHVVSVLQKGYMINDRILRPALVTVSQPA